VGVGLDNVVEDVDEVVVVLGERRRIAFQVGLHYEGARTSAPPRTMASWGGSDMRATRLSRTP